MINMKVGAFVCEVGSIWTAIKENVGHRMPVSSFGKDCLSMAATIEEIMLHSMPFIKLSRCKMLLFFFYRDPHQVSSHYFTPFHRGSFSCSICPKCFIEIAQRFSTWVHQILLGRLLKNADYKALFLSLWTVGIWCLVLRMSVFMTSSGSVGALAVPGVSQAPIWIWQQSHFPFCIFISHPHDPRIFYFLDYFNSRWHFLLSSCLFSSPLALWQSANKATKLETPGLCTHLVLIFTWIWGKSSNMAVPQSPRLPLALCPQTLWTCFLLFPLCGELFISAQTQQILIKHLLIDLVLF